MARIPDITDVPGSGVVVEAIQGRRQGPLRPLDRVLLNSPDLALGWNSFLGAVREKTTLTAMEREVIILRVAALTRAKYEWDAHALVAKKAGATDEQLEVLSTGTGTLGSSDLDLMARVAEEITETTELSEKVFAELQATNTHSQVLEVVLTAAAYNMVSRVINALDISEEGLS